MKIVKKILNVIFYIIVIINILLLIIALTTKDFKIASYFGVIFLFIIISKLLIFLLIKLVNFIKMQIIRVNTNNKINGQRAVYQKTPQQIQYDLDGYKIVSTMIINNDSRKSASSSISRAVVGGTVLGLPGLLGGAISGKNKNTTTFLIQYANGHKETKTVKNNSYEFKEYCNYLF